MLLVSLMGGNLGWLVLTLDRITGGLGGDVTCEEQLEVCCLYHSLLQLLAEHLLLCQVLVCPMAEPVPLLYEGPQELADHLLCQLLASPLYSWPT